MKNNYKWGYATDEFPVQKQLEFNLVQDTVREIICNPIFKLSPLSKFIGNEKAVQRLSDVAYFAWGNKLHQCNEIAWALLGPPSSGKTTLARLFAKTIKLPFIEINSNACSSTDYILETINYVLLNQYKFPLVFMESEGHFELPPMVIFIDEVHNLNNNVVQGLLKAVEYNDAFLTTPNGYSANTNKVTWMIGTTDSGDLFDAFLTRFTQLQLTLYTYDEIAQIVKLNHPELDENVCQLVAKYSDRMPRNALSFAREMAIYKDRHKSFSWETIAEEVANRNNIDEFGMDRRRLLVLKSIKKYNSLSTKNLSYQVGCKEKELTKFVLPPMLISTKDQDRLIKVSSKGIELTKTGLLELEKRGL